MGGLKFVQRVYAYPSVTKYEVSKITLESWRRGGGGGFFVLKKKINWERAFRKFLGKKKKPEPAWRGNKNKKKKKKKDYT